MSRRLILSLLCLSAVVVFVQLSSANSRITVNESASRFLIQDQAIVVLEIANPTQQNLAVRLNLELVDPSDAPRGRAVRDVVLQPGSNRISSPLWTAGETRPRAAGQGGRPQLELSRTKVGHSSKLSHR